MDQNQKQPSSGRETSFHSGIQGSCDQTTEPLASISDLNRRLESSLYVSKTPESKSTDVQANEQYNISQSPGFKESGAEILHEQSSFRKYQSSCYESSSKVQTPESTKTLIDKPPFAITKSADPGNVRGYKPPRFSRQRPREVENPQFSCTDPILYPRGYNYNANPVLFPPSVLPARNPERTHPGQYSQQNQMNPDIIYRSDIDRLPALPSAMGQNRTFRNAMPARHEISHQLPVPPPNIRTDALSAAPLSHSGRTNYNPKSQIRTHATPMQCIRGELYKNSMPPIKTYATPVRIAQNSSRDGNQRFSARMNAPSVQHVELPRTTFPNASGGINYLQHVEQRQNSPSDKDLISSALQPQKSTPENIDNPNTSTPNLGIDEKTKLENLAKRSHYSKRNMLEVDIPKTDPSTSYFPLYATTQGGLLPRQIQRTIIPFPPPPLGIDCFGSTCSTERATIPHLPYRTPVSTVQSYAQSSSHPVVTDQAISRPANQNNSLIHSVSNAGNPMHYTIQAPTMAPPTIQNQQDSKNLTAAIPFQDPNAPNYRYGTHSELATQNVDADTQYQDPNHLMLQYGARYQPTQIQYGNSQYRDPNHPMCQYGTQYQPTQIQYPNSQYQDPNYPMCQYGTQYQPTHIQYANSQYQYPNHPMFQYGTQYQPTHLQYANSQYQDPNRLMWQYGTQYEQPIQDQNAAFQYQDLNIAMHQYGAPTYDTNIPFQHHDSNILPMQTFATNPDQTSMIQNPTGETFVPNVSGEQTSVENPSFISASQHTSEFHTANESTNNFRIDDSSQGTNYYQECNPTDNPEVMQTTIYYPPWSTLTDDPNEDLPIVKDEFSKDK